MTDFNPTSEQSNIINPDRWTSAVIEASAGSGKTSTIIRRAINQVDSFVEQESWKNIAIISFTNKSAEDIKKKVKQLDGNNILAMTFHSFLLQHVLSFSELFRERDRVTFDDYNQRVSSLKNWKSHIKRNNKIPFAENNQKYNKKDYVFEYVLIVLKQYPYIKKYLKSKFIAIYIDEAQDNNSLQYDIVNEFLKLDIQIVMVGDPNQTIYSFRGADSKRFRQLKHDKNYPKYYSLKYNFRCHKYINTCATSYVIPSHDNIDNDNFGVFVQSESEFENTYNNINEGLCFLFRAVNGRRNQVNKNIIEALNLPLISQPKILASSNSPFHLNQLFNMYFGDYKEELEFIENVIPHVKHRIAKKIFCDLKDNPNEDNLDALNELVGEFSEEEYKEILETFNSEEAKQFYKPDSTKNFAMTIHSAKGLEFKNVVLMVHDFISMRTEHDKNMFYVACTRAEKRLYFLKV